MTVLRRGTGPAMRTDICIVHVYRHDADGGQCALAGLVEFVQGGKPRPFRDRDELWQALVAGPAGPARQGAKSSPGGVRVRCRRS
ncbi:MAG: hypothetical protein IPK20_25685 [Betaproteobacteria bacterium]|nr:hypothetical protein [Betaproteobacteria bacterium]